MFLVKYVFIFLVKLYQVTLSQIIPSSCRFYPSCSSYAIGALHKYGVLKGGWLAVKRLSRCHPFCDGGYDPVP